MVPVSGSPSTSQPSSGWGATESGGGSPVDGSVRQVATVPGDPTSGHSVPLGPPAAAGAMPYQAAAQPDRFTRIVERVWTRPGWAAPLAILTCLAGATGLIFASDPTDGRPDAFGGCAVKMLTGFDCPGCGGTRAYWYLLHGNLPEAARHHLFAVFAAPFLVYMYVAWAGRRMFGWRIPQLWIAPKTIGWFVVGWVVFMVLRNLPWAPFTLLYV